MSIPCPQRTLWALCLLLLVSSKLAVCDGPAENWHQWRGPLANGVSPTANPPTTWSEEKNVKWKVEIDGQGTSTPIVWNDRVFLLTAIDTGRKDPSIPDPEDQPKTNFFNIKRPNTSFDFVTLCLDRHTGRELWRRTATTKIPHEGTHQDNDFASASPTTDGERIYCWFGSAGLVCYTLDGQQLWQRQLGEAAVGSSLGEGCSPVVHAGQLVLVRDHSHRGSIEVLDCLTGKTQWKKSRDEDNAWATPLVVEHSGRTQVITAATNFVRSYDLENGDVIWQCGGLTGNVTPCPVLDGDYVICMSGYQGYAAAAFPLGRQGDLSGASSTRWTLDRGTPYVPSPLIYDGLLYFTQSNAGILRCLDAETGQILYGPERLGDLNNIYASPVGCAGRVYITGRNGATIVLKRSQKFEVLATNYLEERFDASPAIAGKQMFLRGAQHLYCIEEDVTH